VNSLERWVAFFVMPLFALANAGVRIDTRTLEDPRAEAVAVAVALGLVLGKPVGIAAFSWLAVRLGVATLPQGVNWRAILATGVLAGIGFTVALFVTALAFDEPVATAGSKIGILGGSLVATAVGLGILHGALPKHAD
jgi:NhaA family Na+:H+ antiporter